MDIVLGTVCVIGLFGSVVCCVAACMLSSMISRSRGE